MSGLEDFRDSDFIELVKRTRQKFNIGIEEAHDLIFADDEVRRLVAQRVNRSGGSCRKQALSDIRSKGIDSRFIMEGERIRFRDPQT